MTAALGTLAFLTTVWMLVVVTAMVLEQSGGKILAALKGHVAVAPVRSATIRIRYGSHSARAAQPIRATARLRAAA
ncbi:MAG: hypothetical protein ABIO29_01105 [Sphingomicrobium sp.]